MQVERNSNFQTSRDTYNVQPMHSGMSWTTSQSRKSVFFWKASSYIYNFWSTLYQIYSIVSVMANFQFNICLYYNACFALCSLVRYHLYCMTGRRMQTGYDSQPRRCPFVDTVLAENLLKFLKAGLTAQIPQSVLWRRLTQKPSLCCTLRAVHLVSILFFVYNLYILGPVSLTRWLSINPVIEHSSTCFAAGKVPKTVQ